MSQPTIRIVSAKHDKIISGTVVSKVISARGDVTYMIDPMYVKAPSSGITHTAPKVTEHPDGLLPFEPELEARAGWTFHISRPVSEMVDIDKVIGAIMEMEGQ